MQLLIDTAFDQCQVGLWHDNALQAQLSLPGEARHDVVLAPLVEQLLQQNHLGVRDLTGVAVVTGPGRFTSLRVGIALARALVLPTQTALIGVATGAVMQSLLPAEHSGWLVMVKRGEVFAQTPHMPEPVVLPLDRITDWLQSKEINHVAVIGAGVPTDWQTLLPANLDTQVLTVLPLAVIGQAADQGRQPSAIQPVRPYYGQSTGAWDMVVPSVA